MNVAWLIHRYHTAVSSIAYLTSILWICLACPAHAYTDVDGRMRMRSTRYVCSRACAFAYPPRKSNSRSFYRKSSWIDSREKSRINSFLLENCRPKKGTAMPGFEPSTLSMPRMPIRYDALDRSTTTAGFTYWLLDIWGRLDFFIYRSSLP